MSPTEVNKLECKGLLVKEKLKKTTLCDFYRQGKCNRGVCCGYAHSEVELRAKPDLYKTQLCRAWQKKGFCERGDKCTFAHGEPEIRSTSKDVVDAPWQRQTKNGQRTSQSTNGSQIKFEKLGNKVRDIRRSNQSECSNKTSGRIRDEVAQNEELTHFESDNGANIDNSSIASWDANITPRVRVTPILSKEEFEPFNIISHMSEKIKIDPKLYMNTVRDKIDTNAQSYKQFRFVARTDSLATSTGSRYSDFTELDDDEETDAAVLSTVKSLINCVLFDE